MVDWTSTKQHLFHFTFSMVREGEKNTGHQNGNHDSAYPQISDYPNPIVLLIVPIS